ncbi:MAG: response regulator [Desulfobacteraceae bacterium]|nr:response regulator [Desulfobacteraceae bacterium]
MEQIKEHLKILVVDDNRDLANNIQDILREKGYTASVAFDGNSASELCALEKFDLVLADYKLPDMDGLQLQEKLSKLMQAEYIIITGHASLESASKAVQQKQIVGYEIKPLDIGRLLAFIRQVGERRRAEKIIAQQSSHMQLAQKMARIGYWSFDIATEISTWSDMIFTILGRDPAKHIPSYDEFRSFIHPDDWNMFDQAVREAIKGTPYHIEMRIIFPDQSIHYVAAQGYPQFDTDGKITGLFGTTQDITERKYAEEQIRTALAEKETLLRELYHRTKNNMQVINGMLSLQAVFSQDKETVEILQELENKIMAMSLVHQKLYQSKNLSRIDLREYINDLAELLMQSYNALPDAVSSRLEMQSVPILIDTAIPCGLILNELISNSFKHAFSKEKQGELQIELTQTGQGDIRLLYSDNGPGVPDEFDFRNRKTLGLQTVLMITEYQLGGTAHFDGSNGLSCCIKFRDTHYKERV